MKKQDSSHLNTIFYYPNVLKALKKYLTNEVFKTINLLL